MKRMKRKWMTCAILIASCFAVYCPAQDMDAPANVVAALLVKVATFEKNLAGGIDLYIYVLGEPDVAAELQKAVGKELGRSTLKRVDKGNALPSEKPSILFIGDPIRANEAVAYCRANKVLSVTHKPALVLKGVTLGFGVNEAGKPSILLNLSSSVEENLDWNPAIMKVAKILK
jgi:hypothetical protein